MRARHVVVEKLRVRADVEEDEERVKDSSVEARDAEPAGSLAGIVMDM